MALQGAWVQLGRVPEAGRVLSPGALATCIRAWPWADSRACFPPQPCMAFSRKENVHRHALRLLIHLHPRVAPSKLEALQKALEPTGQVGAWGGLLCEGAWSLPAPCVLAKLSLQCLCVVSGHPPHTPCTRPCASLAPWCGSPQSGEAVKELYSQLGEKLEQLDHRKPSPAQAAETPALELPLPSVPAPAPL